MASATYRPSRNNLNNHITISETFHPKSHSFPQVSLAKRYDSLSLSSLSLLSSRFETAIVITKFWPYQSQKSYRDRNYSHIFSQLSTITKDIAQSRPQLQFKTLSGIINTNNTPGVSVANNTTTTTTSLYNFWREVQGCNNWDTLLNPLHPLLRQEIIRYGEFVTGSYKAFDLDPNSKRYLNCKYGKKRMLKEVGMENSGYEVTKYIYATPDINIPIQNSSSSSNSGRWIGYVAVASDEATKRLGRRDILITFRGTITYQEWIANFMSSLTPAMLDPHNPRPNVKVESGFLSLYTSDESSSNKFGLESCREQLLSEVSRLLNKYKGESEKLSISLAGHSMGSALALLLAYDIAELGLNKNIRGSIPVICMEKNLSGEVKPISMIPTSQKGLVSDYRLEDTLHAHQKNNEIPITVFSFGGPRVGNLDFKTRCEELGVKVLRIANVNDPITKLPGVLFNENFRVFGGRYEFPWSCSCYAHVGVELMLDFFNVQNPSCVHDLESYIGLLRSPSVEAAQPQREGINNFMEKVRELLLSSHNIKNLQGVFAGSDYYHGLLNSFPRDMLCSCGDELLFGLVLLLL